MNAKCCDGRTSLVYAAWWLVLVLFTYGLLRPDTSEGGSGFLTHSQSFWISKSVHLVAFCFLTLVAALIPISSRHRWLLLGLLVAFAPATECLQTFVEGRHGTITDVVIDLAGVTLGVGLALGWRFASSPREVRSISATTTPT